MQIVIKPKNRFIEVINFYRYAERNHVRMYLLCELSNKIIQKQGHLTSHTVALFENKTFQPATHDA